ncbi:MAG TPA: hypothetical protein VER11_25650 [Polyangiaceae bacterium]|nr:hypothetical protein [Polyangiaceae bacterium]
MKPRVAAQAALVALYSSACRPELDDDYWRVDEPRVLAVKSEPAEARPGELVAFTVFLSAAETPNELPTWSFCTAPKPLTENNAVSAACLGKATLLPAGRGLAIEAVTPALGCSLFGPNTPPGGFRPRDPDITGGYYQPLRIDVPGSEPTFHLQRISCELADASADTAREFGLSYIANRNPKLGPIRANIDGESVALDAIAPGARVELSVSWAASDAQIYTYYDRARQVLTERREAMRVSWYTDGGRLETESSGRTEDDLELDAQNHWIAPESSGPFALWIVLRDSRGGVDFVAAVLSVQP